MLVEVVGHQPRSRSSIRGNARSGVCRRRADLTVPDTEERPRGADPGAFGRCWCWYRIPDSNR